jgi:molecular chaperone DnaK
MEGRVPPALKSEVEQAVSAVRDAIQGEDVQRIRQAAEHLAQAALRLGEATQQAGAAAGGPQEPAGAREQGEPDVVDAEFEEVDQRNRKAG